MLIKLLIQVTEEIPLSCLTTKMLLRDFCLLFFRKQNVWVDSLTCILFVVVFELL